CPTRWRGAEVEWDRHGRVTVSGTGVLPVDLVIEHALAADALRAHGEGWVLADHAGHETTFRIRGDALRSLAVLRAPFRRALLATLPWEPIIISAHVKTFLPHRVSAEEVCRCLDALTEIVAAFEPFREDLRDQLAANAREDPDPLWARRNLAFLQLRLPDWPG